MTAKLTVTVNDEQIDVPNTVTTSDEFLEAAEYPTDGVRDYQLYRIDNNEEVGPIDGLLVFDEGDEFVVIPRTVTGG